MLYDFITVVLIFIHGIFAVSAGLAWAKGKPNEVHPLHIQQASRIVALCIFAATAFVLWHSFFADKMAVPQ